VEERLLAMVVTKNIMPRESNHSTLNEGDLVVMYFIQNGMVVDWTYTILYHMIKANRLTDNVVVDAIKLILLFYNNFSMLRK